MYRELEHHGILGMKWGVRRYQNDDGSLTSAGKERYSKGKQTGDKSLDKEYKKFAKQTEKIKKAQVKEKRKTDQKRDQEAKEEAAEREKILSDPKLLRQNYKKFSTEEVQQAIKNFETERRLSDFSKSRVQQGARFLSSMAQFTSSAIVVYNNVSKAYNAFSPGTKPMPFIKDPEKKKKNKDDDD